MAWGTAHQPAGPVAEDPAADLAARAAAALAEGEDVAVVGEEAEGAEAEAVRAIRTGAAPTTANSRISGTGGARSSPRIRVQCSLLWLTPR
jgi:hypothetical protein